MEKKIIEGKFEPNIAGVVFFMAMALILSALLVWIIAEDAILEIGSLTVTWVIIFILLCAYGIYECYSKKNQQLTVTNSRVHGKIKNKGIDLPFDVISHADITGKTIAITTASGVVKCACCTNANAVYAVILNRLNERTSSKPSFSGTKNVPEELMEYKKLLDNGAITQKEYEAKKKKLLGL